MVLKFLSQNEVFVLCTDVLHVRVLCTLFKLYLVICIETFSTEVFHSKVSSPCATHTTPTQDVSLNGTGT